MLVVAFGAGGLTNLVMSKAVPVGYVIVGLIVLVAIILLVARAVRITRTGKFEG